MSKIDSQKSKTNSQWRKIESEKSKMGRETAGWRRGDRGRDAHGMKHKHTHIPPFETSVLSRDLAVQVWRFLRT